MNGLPMNLIWFRCDLRTTDNSALLAAADGRPCVALYLLSPAQWREHDDAPCKVDFGCATWASCNASSPR